MMMMITIYQLRNTMTTNEKLIYLMESIRIMAQAIDNEAPDLALRKIRILVEQMEEWDA